MTFRRFQNSDARFCFCTRASAFIRVFHEWANPEIIAAGVNAYMPEDFQNLARSIEIFIMEENSRALGFLTVKRIDPICAEIPLIYFDLSARGKGYGSKAIEFLESWVKEHWPEVKSLVLDTIVPEYNGGFYERAGFHRTGPSVVRFPELEVEAVRYEKSISKS